MTPAAEWVCQFCDTHIVTHVNLTFPPIHWCQGRGGRQHGLEPIRLGGDTPDAAA